MHPKEVSVVGEDKRGLAPCISPLSSTAQMLIGTVLIPINHTYTHTHPTKYDRYKMLSLLHSWQKMECKSFGPRGFCYDSAVLPSA